MDGQLDFNFSIYLHEGQAEKVRGDRPGTWRIPATAVILNMHSMHHGEEPARVSLMWTK
jgi:hypothetical protein